MIVALSIVANAAVKNERIVLKNGKSKSNVTLNPSRTYRFVINSKEFKKLAMALQYKSGKINIQIKSPSGKIISSSTKKQISFKKLEKGDYQIVLKNIGSKSAIIIVKSWSTSGDAD